MPPSGLSAAVARARRAVAPADLRSDGALLAAFVAARDGAAFTALVERFGPMVFAVCRRVTGHHQDAEDAFQAVFVVLARKAAAVAPREAVGGWLYGVAVRTAREARAMAARRSAREVVSSNAFETACGFGQPTPDPDLAGVIDAELAALPEKYRTLLVRCDLREEPQVAAAAALGVPIGTVYSRLAAARKLLAARLTARGVSLGAGGLAVALGGAARAAVPGALAARAVAVALALESAPAAVAALSHGVVRAMFLHKLKLAPLAVAVLASAALAAGLLAAPPAPDTPPLRVAAVKAQPPAPPAAARAKSPNRILLYLDGRLVLIDPDGKNLAHVTEDGLNPTPATNPRLSPDGRRVAYLWHEALVRPAPGDPIPDPPARRAFVRTADGTGAATDLGPADSLAWSPDGARLALTQIRVAGKDVTGVHRTVAVADKAAAPLPLPADHVLTDWSPDGKYLLTQGFTPPKAGGKEAEMRLSLRLPTGAEHKALNGPADLLLNGRVSPDGRRVLVEQYGPASRPGGTDYVRRLAVLDAATGAVTPLADYPPAATPLGHSWSPDGRWVVYAWKGRAPDADDPLSAAARLVVCDADGRNPVTILTSRGRSAGSLTLAGPDWR